MGALSDCPGLALVTFVFEQVGETSRPGTKSFDTVC
jgi:hypothetical protein